MEEIAHFLCEYTPFNQLPFEQVERIAAAMEVVHFPAGYDILVYGGRPAEYLYIIRRGNVDLVHEDDEGVKVLDTLGEGESFGHPSLIRGQPPIVTVSTCGETVIYLLPADVFHQLRRELPVFDKFYTNSAIERLSRRLQAYYADADPVLFQLRLRDLVRRRLLTVSPYATVREAAQIMRQHDVSSLVVTASPPGIITDRDLRNRVVAEGLSDTTPVAAVMSGPALTLPADSLVVEGLLTMLEHDIHQMPITENGRVIGLVTRTDILRRRSHRPLFLPHHLERAHSIEKLRAYSDHIAETVGALLGTGARVSDIGRVVAVAHDALLVRLLQDAEKTLGKPPCPYDWLVLGSEGRYEQTLITDQDNALVYADNASPEARAYFTELAEWVVEQLVACGFPRCPGNIMATNPQWRQPLAVWKDYFERWIAMPDEDALLQVTIFFDFRRVYGTLDSESALRPIILTAREQHVFLGRLARAALRQSPPLGFFRQIVLERNGEARDLVNLKVRGTALIVDLARLFALEAGCAATNTLERLRLSTSGSYLSDAGAEELSAAFELISLLRLRHQYKQLQCGETPSNHVPFSQLSALEQRELKESFQAIARIQRSVAFSYQTGRIA